MNVILFFLKSNEITIFSAQKNEQTVSNMLGNKEY